MKRLYQTFSTKFVSPYQSSRAILTIPHLPTEQIARSFTTTTGKMPPYHKATVGSLETFVLPHTVEDNEQGRIMARAMIKAWRKTGIFQIQMTSDQQDKLRECFKTSKEFFQLPFEKKAKFVDNQSFSGYIASGEELTDGIADYAEIFTVTKDLPESDARVQNHWPCHGPCPWPNHTYKMRMNQLMDVLGESGEKLLKLTALGLGLKNPDAFLHLTEDGWHHMRILRFPEVDRTNGKGKMGRGIGSHTDYGLLVIAGQDDVGGLFVRPRVEWENIKNWESGAAGLNEDDEKWLFVPPVKNTLTVFPGKSKRYL
jgi:isopenicillin N synthase-like dioxygenase